MQIFSNAGQDQADKIQAEAQKYVDGPVPSKCLLFSESFFSPPALSLKKADLPAQRTLMSSTNGTSHMMFFDIH